MEKLNNYLQQLLDSRGLKLQLEPNKNPCIITKNGQVDAANMPLPGTQINAMIFSLIPNEVKQQLPNQPEVTFVHPHNLGKFNFSVKKSPSGFNVTIELVNDRKKSESASAEDVGAVSGEESVQSTLPVAESPPSESDQENVELSAVETVSPSIEVPDNSYTSSETTFETNSTQPNSGSADDLNTSGNLESGAYEYEPVEIEVETVPAAQESPESQYDVSAQFEDEQPESSAQVDDPLQAINTETQFEVEVLPAEAVPPVRETAEPVAQSLPSDESLKSAENNITRDLETMAAEPESSAQVGDPLQPIETKTQFEAEVVRTEAARPIQETDKPAAQSLPSEESLKSAKNDIARDLEAMAAQADHTEIDLLFEKMAKAGASDLHLSVSMPPMIRKDGKIEELIPGAAKLTPESIEVLLKSIMPGKNLEEFEKKSDTDFAYEIPGLARFRSNIFQDRKGMGGVFRVIPSEILTAEDLGLPKAIMDLTELSKGLVVVTGPTGSGKSTTLCAMIDAINKNREDHVITIEDPIEFTHENKKCLINQREVHNHTNSFKDALRAALREDPDIVLVGEMRDLETISIAIETAETGHLVFGTLHTTTAASTVDRIIDQFPGDQQQQIRVMLSESLKGVIAQTLLPKKGGGRVAALEVLIVTPAIANLIREGKTFQIASQMQTGKNLGMQMLNDSLIDLVNENVVEPREAYLKASDKNNFEVMLQRNGKTL